jgi:hypothetical protein
MKRSKRTNSSASSISKEKRIEKFAKRHPSFKKEKSWKHQHRYTRQKGEPKDSLDRREKQEAKTLRTNPIVEQNALTGIPLKGVIRMRHLKSPLQLTYKQMNDILTELDSPVAAPHPEDLLQGTPEGLDIIYVIEGACSVCWREYPKAAVRRTATQAIKESIEKLENEEMLDEMPEDIDDLLEDEEEPAEENPCIMDCCDPREVQSGLHLHGKSLVIIPLYLLGEHTTLRKYVENVLYASYADEPSENGEQKETNE